MILEKSMREFVLGKIPTTKSIIDIYNYASFLSTPLNIGMFVPCVEDVEVLEEPEFYHLYGDAPIDDETDLWQLRCEKYKQAKERCLFEGFELRDADWCDEVMLEISNESKKCFLDYCVETKTFSFVDEEDWAKTIEDLIPFKLKLTDNAVEKYKL